MTGTATLLTITSILLQYSLLLFVYFFLFRVLKLAYAEFSAPCHSKASDDTPAIARLTVVATGKSPLSAAQFSIDESIAIGRSDHNDIIVDDSFVSAEHACITAVKQDFVLTDLHSTNGTYLNNGKIAEDVVLQPGDIIRVGPASFKFER